MHIVEWAPESFYVVNAVFLSVLPGYIVGSILGWGFAPYSGGTLSFIDTIGTRAFVEECDRLAQKYGPRFTPNKWS